jgi:CheY-like chemotaxis protein
LIDDDKDSVESLGQLLEQFGYEVRKATDPKKAVEIAAQVKPQVVITDIAMPVMNGYDVAAAIRDKLGPKNVRLVAISGYVSKSDRARARKAGFDMYLAKPAGSQDIIAAIEGTLTLDQMDE